VQKHVSVIESDRVAGVSLHSIECPTSIILHINLLAVPHVGLLIIGSSLKERLETLVCHSRQLLEDPSVVCR